MKLNLFTPEKTLLDSLEIKELNVPSVKGRLGILPGHASLVSLLKAGVLRYTPKESQREEKIALGWGYLEVYQGDVRILAESAATKASLDKAKIEKDLKEVLQVLEKKDIEPSERKEKEKEKLWLEGMLEL